MIFNQYNQQHQEDLFTDLEGLSFSDLLLWVSPQQKEKFMSGDNIVTRYWVWLFIPGYAPVELEHRYDGGPTHSSTNGYRQYKVFGKIIYSGFSKQDVQVSAEMLKTSLVDAIIRVANDETFEVSTARQRRAAWAMASRYLDHDELFGLRCK